MALDLPLSADQQLLQDNIRRFLSSHPKPGWRELSDVLGLSAVTVPVEAGGFGGGIVDMALVMAELGPALAGSDWLPHAVAIWVLGQLSPTHDDLADLAAGRRRIAIVCAASGATMPVIDTDFAVRGSANLVPGGAEADLLLLADADAILLVHADGQKIEQRHRIMLDGSVSADLCFALESPDAELLASGPAAQEAAEIASDMMRAARCAEAVGLMQRMIADSVEYLGQRKQFGRPIGSFQALRHRLADMQIAQMRAAALTEAAISSIENRTAAHGRTVSGACVEVADAVRIVGEGAVQLHGAMGLTEELGLGGRFKRALAIAAGLGARADHLARFADAGA